MRKVARWGAIVAAAVLLLAVAALLALRHWAASDALRERVAREATAALGLPVAVARVSVAVWPLPAVALEGLEVRSKPALTVEQVEVRPAWGALLGGRLEIASVRIVGATVPQAAVDAIAAARQKLAVRARPVSATAPPAAVVLPRRWVVERLAWVTPQRRSTLDGLALMADDGLPGTVELQVRQGWLAGADLALVREGAQWTLDARIGGGTVRGQGLLERPAAGWRLRGELQTAQVEVSALTAPSRPLSGRLEAQTTLQAQARTLGELGDVLRSQTRFTVRGAVVHGVDLAQAVKTAGTQHSGQTRLDTLAGQVSTQGKLIQLTQLVASSGLLAATGQVTVAPDKQLSGRVAVDVAGGALGVPLVVGGTVDDPSVTLSRAALLGAAIGTLAAPGAGTAAGASVGERLGRSLGGLLGR